MAKKKRYGKVFQLGAARLVVEQGVRQAETARRPVVSSWSIDRWIEKFPRSGELPPQGETVPASTLTRGWASGIIG